MPAKPDPPSRHSRSGRPLKPSQRAADGGYVVDSAKNRQARLQKEARSQTAVNLDSEPEYDPRESSLPRQLTKWQSPIPTGHIHVDHSRRNAARSEWIVNAINYRNGINFEADLASGAISLSTLEQIWQGKSLDDEDGSSGRVTGASTQVNVGLPNNKISFGTQLDILKSTTTKKAKNRTRRLHAEQYPPARFSPLEYPSSLKAAGKKRARSPTVDDGTPPPPAKVTHRVQEHPHRSMRQRTVTPEAIPVPRQPFATFFSQPVRTKQNSALATASSSQRPNTQVLRVYTGPLRTIAAEPRSNTPGGPRSAPGDPRPRHTSTPDGYESHKEAINASYSTRTQPEDSPRTRTHNWGHSTRPSEGSGGVSERDDAQNLPGTRQQLPQQRSRARASATPQVHNRNRRQTPRSNRRPRERSPLAPRSRRQRRQVNARRVDDDDEDPDPDIDQFGDDTQDVHHEQAQNPNKPVLRLFYPLELRYLVRAVSERVVARMLADGTYTDVLLADDENPNYVSLLEEVAGEEWTAECERRPLRNEYDLSLIHIKYFRGLITSWRARIKERILVEFRSRFSLGKDWQETRKRANKLLPNAFHSDQESNTHGLFKGDVVAECVRLAVYFNKHSFGARFPEYFNPIPLGLIGLVASIANHVISLFESGTFRPRSLNVREQAPNFAYYLDYLEEMEELRPQRLENIRLAVRDYCLGSLPKPVGLHAPPPRQEREMTPDSPHQYKPQHFDDGSSGDEEAGLSGAE